MNNKINKDCIIHKKICDRFCISSKCVNKILCQKCIRDHQQIHPKQFIYTVQNLCQIHSFDKMSKMKQVLGKFKVVTQQRIVKIYNPFIMILEPLICRLKQFQKQSKEMLIGQLYEYLSKNKNVIENIKIVKSDTTTMKTNPQKLIDQTIGEVQIINQKQTQLKQNTQNFTWYADATQQLCLSAQTQLTSLIRTAIKLLDNYQKIQTSKFEQTGKDMSDDQPQTTFYKKYVANHDIAAKKQKNCLENTLAQVKSDIQRKDNQFKRARNQIKQKQSKIQQLHIKINILSQQVLQWQQKAQRQQLQKQQAAQKQKKKLQAELIKQDIIQINQNKKNMINLSKRIIPTRNFQLIFELIPNPTQLQLNSHQLSNIQLNKLCKQFTSLEILRMSFLPKCQKQFLAQALKSFQNLHTLQLNSCKLDDDTLKQISYKFPLKLRHLSLMDNLISDQGLQSMFMNYKSLFDNRNNFDMKVDQKKDLFQSLYLSFNKLGPRCIEIIARSSIKVKVLHISRIQIRNKGAVYIGKSLKDLQQLFIGGTGIQKQGFFAICRGCLKLKKLCLVQTQITAQIVLDILSHLQLLDWLDVRHSPTLNQEDIEKIEKFKIIKKYIQILVRN